MISPTVTFESSLPTCEGMGTRPGRRPTASRTTPPTCSPSTSNWDLVVGHSLAGPIVTTAAMTSGFTRSLLLLDPVFDIDDDTFPDVAADQVGELNLTASQLLDAHPEWHPEDRDLKLRAGQMTSAFVVERCLTDSAPWHHLALLTHDALPPTTILAADPEVGTMFPPEHAQRVASDHVRYEALPGIGHGIHRELPDRVVQSVIHSLTDDPAP